jgi:acyl carrier protein
VKPVHEQKLTEIFRAVFGLEEAVDVRRVRQLGTPTWDSLAHVTLVAALENEFQIAIEAADSLELTSYEAAANYLEERGL